MTKFIFLLLSPLLLILCAATETSLRSVTDTLSHDRNAGFHKSSTSSGIITTVAGNKLYTGSVKDGIAATSGFILAPQGIALDNVGNFYFAASGDNKIYKVTAGSGVITTVAGTGAGSYGGNGGQATSAMLFGPMGVTLDTAGDILIADTRNNRIRKITMSTGLITTVAGDGNQGDYQDNVAATRTSLYSPYDVAVDPSGNMFIADAGYGLIRKVTASTGIMTTIAGTATYGDRFRVSYIATKYFIESPTGVALDTAGNVYVAGGKPFIFKIDVRTGNISIVAGTGPYLTGIEGYNDDDILATTAKLNNPTKIAFDASGNMYISDSGNRRIRKVTASTGIITTVAGTGGAPLSSMTLIDGGLATAASLYTPSGIAVDTAGNFYFADRDYNLVRKVTYTGATPSISVTSAPSVQGAPSAPVASTPTQFISTAPAPSPAPAPTLAVTPSASISLAPTPGASSSSISSSPFLSRTVTPSKSISMAPTPRTSSPSYSKAPAAPSSTARQRSSATHFAQTLHLTIILLSSLLILHLCRDA